MSRTKIYSISLIMTEVDFKRYEQANNRLNELPHYNDLSIFFQIKASEMSIFTLSLRFSEQQYDTTMTNLDRLIEFYDIHNDIHNDMMDKALEAANETT